MVVLLVLGGLLIATSLWLVWSATTAAPSGVDRSVALLQAMSATPEALTKEVEDPFVERVLKPLQERALVLGRRLTGGDASERLRRKLELAGNPPGWTVDRVVSTKVIGAVVGGVVALLLSLLMGTGLPVRLVMVAAGVAVGFFGPNMWLYQKAYDREARISKELPDAIDLLTISVESGLGFDAALQQVARNTEGPLADELARVLREMQIGSGRADALRALAERSASPDLRSFVGAMVQADAFGIPIGSVLRVQTSEMRVKRRQRAEEAAQKVPVKITVPLIFTILPTLFIAVLGPAAISIMGNLTGR